MRKNFIIWQGTTYNCHIAFYAIIPYILYQMMTNSRLSSNVSGFHFGANCIFEFQEKLIPLHLPLDIPSPILIPIIALRLVTLKTSKLETNI